MFAKIMVLSLAIAFTVFAVLGILIQQTGLVIVDVQDRDGRVYLPIPLLFVNSVLSVASIAERITLPHEFKQHSDLVQAATDELLRCPDGPFVEVKSPQDDVVISKRGSDLVIDVKSKEQKIFIQIPIEATSKTLAKLSTLDR